MNEVASNLLKIDSKLSRSYTIKFNKLYNPSIITKAIRFTDIVEDAEIYQKTPEKIENRINIKVEI